MSKAKARAKEPSTGGRIASSRQTTNALMQLGLSSTSVPPGHAANRNCTVGAGRGSIASKGSAWCNKLLLLSNDSDERPVSLTVRSMSYCNRREPENMSKFRSRPRHTDCGRFEGAAGH